MVGRTKGNWLWAVITFVVGLAIGLGLFAWQFTTTERTIAVARQRLESDNASLTAENQRLSSQLRTMEASLAAAAAGLQQAGGSTDQTSSAGGGSSAETTVTGPLVWVERSVSPQSVGSGGKQQITLVVKLKGGATKVTMLVRSVASGGYDKTHFLAKTDSSGGVETWKRTITAPSAKGTYRYSATAYQDTKKYVMPGDAGFTFQVK